MNASPEISPDLIQKARKYFYEDKYDRVIKAGVPTPISWHHVFGVEGLRNQAKNIIEHGSLGYTGTGTDTAQKREDIDQLIISNTNPDTICADFEYDSFGLNTIGKTIVDVAAGNSPFAEDMNFLYGQYGTRVIAVDAKYPLHTGDKNKVRMMAQDMGELREDFHNTGFADEVISRYGVTLVPKEDFPHSVNEMLSLCKEKGVVKIVPCHILKEITIKECEDGTTEQYVGTIQLPKGIRVVHRVGVDIWRLDIQKGEVNPQELQAFLAQLDTPDVREAMQLWDSADLHEKRKNGFYTMAALSAIALDFEEFDIDAFLVERGFNIDTYTRLQTDESGKVIVPESGKVVKAT